MVRGKGAHCEQDLILPCGRWSLAYPLSDHRREARMQERGVTLDHSTIPRWVLKYAPSLENAFHRRKRPGGGSWRTDEASIKKAGRSIATAQAISLVRASTASWPPSGMARPLCAV
jgi:putative transposase